MNKEQQPISSEQSDATQQEKWEALTDEQKKVVLALPLVKRTGEPADFISEIIGDELSTETVTTALEELAGLGIVTKVGTLYTVCDFNFVTFTQNHIAAWQPKGSESNE